MLPQTLDPSTPEIMTGPPFCCSQLLIGTRAGEFDKITVLKDCSDSRTFYYCVNEPSVGLWADRAFVCFRVESGEEEWGEGEGNPPFICYCNKLLEGVNRSLDNLWRKFSFIIVLKLIREIIRLCGK